MSLPIVDTMLSWPWGHENGGGVALVKGMEMSQRVRERRAGPLFVCPPQITPNHLSYSEGMSMGELPLPLSGCSPTYGLNNTLDLTQMEKAQVSQPQRCERRAGPVSCST